jgi:signal transduction histidine kinase/CheY-like chemotaxis protein
MESIKHVWTRFTAPPESPDLSQEQLDRWGLRNAVYLLGAICSFFGVLAFLPSGLIELYSAAFLVFAGFLLGYLLSRRGHRRMAGVFGILPLDITLVVNSQNFGPGLFESSVLVYICLAFLLFEREDLLLLCGVVGVSIAAAALAAIPWWPEPPIPLPQAKRVTLHVSTLIMVAMQMSVVMMHFLLSRNRAVAQLHAALQRSQDASEAKSRFLANMSHEIRTPLNGVLGMLSVLDETQLGRNQQSYVQTARTSGQILLDIINDILDLAKVEAGELVLEPGAFDLRAVVEDAARQAAVQTRGKELEVIAQYPPQVPTFVIGDAGRVRQVLVNLLGNAVKFTVQGQITVAIDYQQDERNGGSFLFTVSDTGIGIPADAHALIFDKFKQVDSSSTRRQGGTGLGLAIVKELVTRMGGEVGVRGRPQRGTTFWVRLPLAVDPDAPEPATPGEAAAGTRVLVVDDDPLCGQVLGAQLEHWEMRVSTCTSSAAAREALRQAASSGAPFDMAFIDCDMPDMSGFELAAMVARDSALGKPLAFLVATMAEILDEARLGEIGCAGYVRKPIQESELREAIESRGRARRETEGVPRLSAGLPTNDSARLKLRAQLNRVRVLVVEDNAINQKVATRMLMNLGCTADVAANGREAIELLAGVPYDLIFMDVQMPEMDGLEATAAIRAREAGSGAHVPIIAMTAHAMADDRQRCLNAGMDGYVSKPVKLVELVAVLEKHLGAGPAA